MVVIAKVTAMQLIVQYFTATPVGIIIPGTQGTMDHLLEIIPTENTPIPVPEMTMAQCQEDIGMSGLIYWQKWRSDISWLSTNNCSYDLVTVMGMAEVENLEATWTVQVVAHIEIHMMVTVRY